VTVPYRVSSRSKGHSEWATLGLSEWRLMKCGDARLRVVGMDVSTGEQRVTSALECIDLACRVIHTCDERALLLAPFSPNSDCCETSSVEGLDPQWRTWVAHHDLLPYLDVTPILLEDIDRVCEYGQSSAMPEKSMSAESKRFLTTLVEAEVPIHWDLVRTAALHLLNGVNLSDGAVVPLMSRGTLQSERPSRNAHASTRRTSTVMASAPSKSPMRGGSDEQAR